MNIVTLKNLSFRMHIRNIYTEDSHAISEQKALKFRYNKGNAIDLFTLIKINSNSKYT